MATYQGGAHVKEQIESFATQSVLPDELIISDDGSTDKTLEVVEEFKKTAPFTVIVLKGERNVGIIKNFEKALSACTGDIIFLSDQDDVWFPNKLSIVRDVFRGQVGVRVVVNDQVITDEKLVPVGVTAYQNARRLGLTDRAIITGCCTAMTRSWRDFCVPFPENIPAHDNWIGNLAISLDVRAFITEPLQFYRRHGSNASGWVVNSSEKLNIARLVHSVRSQDVRVRWQREVSMLNSMRERITRSRIAGVSPVAVRAAEAGIDKQLYSFHTRMKIIEEKWYIRAIMVAKLLSQGGYSSIASAVADLVR